MDTVMLSFGLYPSDNQTLLVHLIVPYSVSIQWSSNPLRNRFTVGEHRALPMRSTLLWTISAEKANLPCPRLWTPIIEKSAFISPFHSKYGCPFLWNVKSMICLYLLRKTTAILQIPIVDTSPKFHLSITLGIGKRAAWSAQTAPYAESLQHNILNFCISTNKSARQSMQTVIYYHRPVHSYHLLKTVMDYRSSLVWNCSMTSQKYRVVCLSASIIRNQLDKIWLSGNIFSFFIISFQIDRICTSEKKRAIAM